MVCEGGRGRMSAPCSLVCKAQSCILEIHPHGALQLARSSKVHLLSAAPCLPEEESTASVQEDAGEVHHPTFPNPFRIIQRPPGAASLSRGECRKCSSTYGSLSLGSYHGLRSQQDGLSGQQDAPVEDVGRVHLPTVLYLTTGIIPRPPWEARWSRRGCRRCSSTYCSLSLQAHTTFSVARKMNPLRMQARYICLWLLVFLRIIQWYNGLRGQQDGPVVDASLSPQG